MTTVRDFREDMAFERTGRTLRERFYRRHFHAQSIDWCDQIDLQLAGIDLVLGLPSGKHVSIDEKVRREDWPDVIFERYSDSARKKLGWLERNLSDFIIHFWPSGRALVLPTPVAQVLWRERGARWLQDYPHKFSENGSYVTESVVVPLLEVTGRIHTFLQVPEGKDGWT